MTEISSERLILSWNIMTDSGFSPFLSRALMHDLIEVCVNGQGKFSSRSLTGMKLLYTNIKSIKHHFK